jgi:hypothetical protein
VPGTHHVNEYDWPGWRSSLSRKLWFTSRTRARLLPTLVQVTRVAAAIVSELGLNGPPPPAIVMLALAIKLQLGCGLGLGDGLVPGEGLGLMPGDGLGLMPGDGLGLMPGDGLGLMPGDGLGLMPGDGLGLMPGDGLGPWASVIVAPALKKSMPMMTTTHWIQSGWVTRRISGERLVLAASL